MTTPAVRISHSAHPSHANDHFPAGIHQLYLDANSVTPIHSKMDSQARRRGRRGSEGSVQGLNADPRGLKRHRLGDRPLDGDQASADEIDDPGSDDEGDDGSKIPSSSPFLSQLASVATEDDRCTLSSSPSLLMGACGPIVHRSLLLSIVVVYCRLLLLGSR